MFYPSKLIEEAVEEISRLPGIGKKTALRLALHLLKQPESSTNQLSEALVRLKKESKFCLSCHMIADDDQCQTCASPRTDRSIICVVEDTPDVIAIQNTGQFQGLFHVLGGVISPMNGIGPDDLHISSLIHRVLEHSEVQELILALSPTMEGDTTAFYIQKKLTDRPIKISSIARGIPIGGELEYADEITLGRSILSRVDYSPS